MKKILYLECLAGISGDMAAAALIDLGADREALSRALDSIPDRSFRTEISRVSKAGIDCCDFNVILDAEHENHDHDMEYLHGHDRGGSDHGVHEHGDHAHDDHEHGDHDHGDHAHDDHDHHVHGGHDHDHHHHGHGHSHRSFREVREILAGIDMSGGAHALALRVFTILAESEAKAHNRPVDEVMFHEVGAIDSIVDIVTCAVCFDSLGIDEVIIPFLAEGTGTVRCQHGILPVPVPAVLNIVEKWGLPLRIGSISGEFVTPTGAAFAAAVRTGGRLPETFSVIKTGLGAGKRNYERASILRAMLLRDLASGEEETAPRVTGSAPERSDGEEGTIWKLETNIDDSTGEQLGHTMKLLLTAGARDVFYTPIFMKKNRPAYLLSVICDGGTRERLEEIIFAETTTIGIRRFPAERTCLERKILRVDTEIGEAQVKAVTSPGGTRYYPEYESAALLAEKSGRTLREVYGLIEEACRAAGCAAPPSVV